MTAAPRALVVGAGIAGLATAVRLHGIGWDVELIERAPGRRTGGYAVNFAGLGYDAAERMGFLPALINKNLVYDNLAYLTPRGAV